MTAEARIIELDALARRLADTLARYGAHIGCPCKWIKATRVAAKDCEIDALLASPEVAALLEWKEEA